MDATLSKRFKITESAGATLRLEAYNVFNNPSFGTPAASMATMTSLGKFSSTTGSARVAQVAARFDSDQE